MTVCIHILQRKQSHTTGRPVNTQSSLFSYCEHTSCGEIFIIVISTFLLAVRPVDADKFVYTHWFRGTYQSVS